MIFNKRKLKNIIRRALEEDMHISLVGKSFVGYFENGKLLGVVGFYVNHSQKMIGFVSAYVLPEHRHKGIYKILSEFRLSYVKNRYPNYSVYLTANNNSKHQMKKLGFTIIEPQYRMKLDL